MNFFNIFVFVNILSSYAILATNLDNAYQNELIKQINDSKDFLDKIIGNGANSKQLEHISIREELGTMMENRKATMMCLIGVRDGAFAEKILSKWPSFKRFLGIDPWLPQKNWLDEDNVDLKQNENNYLKAVETLNKFGRDRYDFVPNYPLRIYNYLDYIRDDSTDLLHLDGRKDFCSFYEELNAFYTKVKCNGIISGSNFINVMEQMEIYNNQDWSICPDGSRVLTNGGAVKGAVIEFMRIKKIDEIFLTKEQPQSFYFIKKC